MSSDGMQMDEDPPPKKAFESNNSDSAMDWVGLDDKLDDYDILETVSDTSTKGSFAENTTSAAASTLQRRNYEEKYSFDFSTDDDDEMSKLADASSDDIKSFDMQILQSSIEESTQAFDLVLGKDVVMVVGKTGVGKSTLIQGIAGKHIHAVDYTSQSYGETATKTVYDAQDALENFEIGHGNISKTSALSAYLRKDMNGTEFVYLDSPGVGDTRGVEVDIATFALLRQVAKRCKSLRFVVLVHCASLLEDRGNAFRSVVKFAKRFVQDFDESKLSFMFLFTHSDEIGVSKSSLEIDPKKWLQNEIVHISEAVIDEDISKVLSFIGTSLKKDYPFAGIFHPLNTDYEELASSIEEKLQPLEDLESASNCMLPLSPQLKLEVALQNLLQRLQMLVNSPTTDISAVKDTQMTVHYLREYIDVPSVCKAVLESEEIIQEHQISLRRSIKSDYERWSSQSSDFTEVNALALKNTLYRLHQFDSTFSVENWAQSKAGALLSLKDDILARANNFMSFHRQLQKLQVWVCTFEEYSGYYSDLTKCIVDLFEGALKMVSQTELSTIHELQGEVLASFVHSFLLLHTMDAEPDQELKFDQSTASKIEKVLKDVADIFRSWVAKASEMLDSSGLNFEVDLGDVTSYARFLEKVKGNIEQYGIDVISLHQLVDSSLMSVLHDAKSLCHSCCNDIADGTSDLGFEVQRRLSWMQDACVRFSSLNCDSSTEMCSLFSIEVSKIKSSLLSTSAELATTSKYAEEHGLRNGVILGQDVASFKKCRWFDIFLPEGEAFVTNSCIEIERAINTRIDAKSNELSRVDKCLVRGRSSDAITRLGELLPELKEIDDYLESNIPTDVDVTMEDAEGGPYAKASPSLARKCAKILEDYSLQLGKETMRHVDKWASSVDCCNIEPLSMIAQDLEFILADAKALNNAPSIGGITSESDSIIANISKCCNSIAQLTSSELSSFHGDFLLKASILELLVSCSRLPHLRQKLPDLSKNLHQTRNMVAAEAQRLEIEIERRSDWNQIDNELELFKKAVVLDRFVNGEATARLHTLNRLREKKEEQVDEHLQSMIDAYKFKGLVDFLTPLANSNDQIKKQRFGSYLDDIVHKLELVIHDINRCMTQDFLRDKALPTDKDTIQMIAQKMIILATAADNLQCLIQPRLDLALELSKLETIIDSGLEPHLAQFSRCIAKKDFIRSAVLDVQISLMMQHLEKYFQLPTKKHQVEIKEKYELEVNAVLGYVNEFVESRFRSTNNLLTSLTSLSEAKERNGVIFERLTSMYDMTQKLLLDRVREFIRDTQETVAEHDCFDEVIPILHMLQREMEGSFRHFFPNEMVLDCNRLREHLEQAKKEHDRLLEFGDKDVKEKLGVWRNKLDKLRSPNFKQRFQRLFGFGDKSSYENQKRVLLSKCNERFRQADQALRLRDLRRVEECIGFLVLVENELCNHVDINDQLLKLQERCMNEFLDLCQLVGKTLEKKDTSKFEEMFVDYRGFILYIPCILASKQGQKEFALVNQLLHESFVHHLDVFHDLVKNEVIDCSDIKIKVTQLRKMGAFMSDRVTVLNEEIKYSSSDEKGKVQWLDEIQALCSKHFSDGRDLGKLRFCIDLGVAPSATEKEIKTAYKQKAKLYHPDKGGSSELFRRVKEAQDELLGSNRFKTSGRPQAFDAILSGIGEHLRALSRQFMHEQRYDMAESLLFQLPALKELDNLVEPQLNSKEVQESVRGIIKGHVEKMRVEVDTAWSERRYQDLNDSITDLKAMESSFKAYPDIFSTSWNCGIVETIEAEIVELGKKAKACLLSHAVAKKKEADFKRHLIRMGSVLVELPPFASFTRREMSNVLDSCLDKVWGYSYLFEFGLSMQTGDDFTDDREKRIAQMTVAEFDHFKEVLTMCWNQETSQKPVEDVVVDITGEYRSPSSSTGIINIDQDELIQSFKIFDTQYKTLLGEYIKPDAQLPELVKLVKRRAKKLLPISCDKKWTDDEKKHIPFLLAGVFSLFTVIKSGASFNRIEEAGGSSSFGDQLLMKPHNIQVLTLLYMFGCGKGSMSSLDSQLMQIRTGEGKSMILGAAATVLSLLGFRVRTVCYSEYLSSRDFSLFEEVFQKFGVLDLVTYSKITTFSEDSIAMKGNIRELAESLLRGQLSSAGSIMSPPRNHETKPPAAKSTFQMLRSFFLGESGSSAENEQQHNPTSPAFHSNTTLGSTGWKQSSSYEEILLVDEVDVFFGAEFYGKTYNQVIEFKEPEIAAILKRVWEAHCNGGRLLRLNDVKCMSDYKSLLAKMPSFDFVLDNEINLMLSQVKRVDDVPYVLDPENDRIGYKVMDTISYNVTFGYVTIFAYLKEAENLKNKAAALSRALVMPISCGQFSYANISPTRIMGVSGTLASIGENEKRVLDKYGLNKYIFVPSVYGASNFQFDKAGDGIDFESSKSNFYHKISAEIVAATKSRRAVIVFFRDRPKLDEFVSSATYRQLGRHKSLLLEDMSPREKDFVISKAATSGQITLSTAVFGRGTDFFCKDDSVEKNGGVHIIQTFLSKEVSEEVQIKGRTARQGKRGSYQMILMESDIETDFGITIAEKDQLPKGQWYDWLCKVRAKHQKEQSILIEESLQDATEKDILTHTCFDSLLAGNKAKSMEQFKNLYQIIKKPPVPSSVQIDIALVIDVTGSMAPYAQSTVSTIENLLHGRKSLISKLSSNFPDIEFQLRVGCLCFRDIDDGADKFIELELGDGSHFTDDVSAALHFVKSACASPSGGFDLAEDIVGAIHRSANWRIGEDWTSDIKFMMLFSDAAAHGHLPAPIANGDNYATRHPEGLTTKDAVASLVARDADLFFCSFNPPVTRRTEDKLSKYFQRDANNFAEHSITHIPMVPKEAAVSTSGAGQGRHIIFVLDESGSMSCSWSGVVAAYNQYIAKRKQSQSDTDLVSVVQFNGSSRITVQHASLSSAPNSLPYSGGGTCFHPASVTACELARGSPSTHVPAIVFMSDGHADDAVYAADEFELLNRDIYRLSRNHLELHVIGFGGRSNSAQLEQIASASQAGRVYSSANTADLASVFVEIASTQNVTLLLESEIAKKITEAVSDKLSIEYFGSYS